MTSDKKFKRLVRDRARQTGESYLSARRQLLLKRKKEPVDTTEVNEFDDQVEVTVAHIRVSPRGDGVGAYCTVEFQEADGPRRLPVFIGEAEGRAIAAGIQELDAPRPLTHDMLKQTVEALGARVDSVFIRLQDEDNIYTADVVLVLQDGSESHIDCRVSDAVALVVRCDPRPRLLVHGPLLKEEWPTEVAPGTPLSWPVQVRCSCGTSVSVAEEDLLPPESEDASYVEAATECRSCGRRARIRLQRTTG